MANSYKVAVFYPETNEYAVVQRKQITNIEGDIKVGIAVKIPYEDKEYEATVLGVDKSQKVLDGIIDRELKKKNGDTVEEEEEKKKSPPQSKGGRPKGVKSTTTTPSISRSERANRRHTLADQQEAEEGEPETKKTKEEKKPLQSVAIKRSLARKQAELESYTELIKSTQLKIKELEEKLIQVEKEEAEEAEKQSKVEETPSAQTSTQEIVIPVETKDEKTNNSEEEATETLKDSIVLEDENSGDSVTELKEISSSTEQSAPPVPLEAGDAPAAIEA